MQPATTTRRNPTERKNVTQMTTLTYLHPRLGTSNKQRLLISVNMCCAYCARAEVRRFIGKAVTTAADICGIIYFNVASSEYGHGTFKYETMYEYKKCKSCFYALTEDSENITDYTDDNVYCFLGTRRNGCPPPPGGRGGGGGNHSRLRGYSRLRRQAAEIFSSGSLKAETLQRGLI